MQNYTMKLFYMKLVLLSCCLRAAPDSSNIRFFLSNSLHMLLKCVTHFRASLPYLTALYIHHQHPIPEVNLHNLMTLTRFLKDDTTGL